MSLNYNVLKDDVRAGRPIDFGFVTYVPERTCRLIHEVEEDDDEFFDTVELHYYVCSECGWNNRPDAYYCDSCGARVIEEES